MGPKAWIPVLVSRAAVSAVRFTAISLCQAQPSCRTQHRVVRGHGDEDVAIALRSRLRLHATHQHYHPGAAGRGMRCLYVEVQRYPAESARLERDDFSSNRHPALSFCLSMIFPENRYPLFRIMLYRLHSTFDADIGDTAMSPQEAIPEISRRSSHGLHLRSSAGPSWLALADEISMPKTSCCLRDFSL
jgi:hypothetical protein